MDATLTRGPAVLAYRAAGQSPGPEVWASLLHALTYWPSPARIGIERRLTRVGRQIIENVVVTSDAMDVLNDEAEQLAALLRPLRERIALRPARVAVQREGTVAYLRGIGRSPAAVGDRALAGVVEELLRLPVGAGLSVAAWRAPRTEDDEQAELRLGRIGDAMEIVLRPVVPPSLDAAVRLWSPAPLPPVFLARAGAAFGEQPMPEASHDSDSAEQDGALVLSRVAALLGARGLTPPDRSKAARLGRPHTGALATHGAELGRVLTDSGGLRTFRLPWHQRQRHVFLCGRTGSGKSELIARLVADDLAEGRSVVLVDPHGDLADRVLAHVPADRHDDVVLIDPSHPRTAAIPAMTRGKDSAQRAAAYDRALIEAVDEGRSALTSGRLRRPAAFAIDVLDATPGVDATMVSVDRVICDQDVRDGLAFTLGDSHLARMLSDRGRQFWDWGTARGALFGLSAGRHAFDHIPRWDLPASLGAGGVVIARLDQSQLGVVDTSRFGRLLLSLIHAATTIFASLPTSRRPQLSVVVDEAHLFTGSDVLGSMLSQLRKFGAALTLCTQTPTRLGPLLPDVLTNCATILAMQLPRREATPFGDRGGRELVERISQLPRFHAAMMLDDDDDPRPLVLHPAGVLPDHPEARSAVIATARRRHGRRVQAASRGDLDRFALLADAAGIRTGFSTKRDPDMDGDTFDELVTATLRAKPLPRLRARTQ